MTDKNLLLSNATVVLPDRVIHRGWVAVAGGRIRDKAE